MEQNSIVVSNDKFRDLANWCEQHLNPVDYDMQVINMLPIVARFTFHKPVDLTAAILHN